MLTMASLSNKVSAFWSVIFTSSVPAAKVFSVEVFVSLKNAKVAPPTITRAEKKGRARHEVPGVNELPVQGGVR